MFPPFYGCRTTDCAVLRDVAYGGSGASAAQAGRSPFFLRVLPTFVCAFFFSLPKATAVSAADAIRFHYVDYCVCAMRVHVS